MSVTFGTDWTLCTYTRLVSTTSVRSRQLIIPLLHPNRHYLLRVLKKGLRRRGFADRQEQHFCLSVLPASHHLSSPNSFTGRTYHIAFILAHTVFESGIQQLFWQSIPLVQLAIASLPPTLTSIFFLSLPLQHPAFPLHLQDILFLIDCSPSQLI